MPLGKHLKLLGAASLLAMSLAVPATAFHGHGGNHAEVTSQLPRNAAPRHYSIRIEPDAANLSFTAQTAIDIDLKEASSSVTLNAADLQFKTATITPKGGKAITARVETDNAAQTATVIFPKELQPGAYRLDFDYSGVILQQANGLFALDYKDNAGADKRSLFTQFEAPDARRMVPSWDEPNYKATFDLTAIVPADEMAVSNMPGKTRNLGNGKAEVVFETTPKMSTYLLFFGTGEFDRIAKQAGSTEVGIVMGRGNADKGHYALDSSAKIVEYYNDYFGVPFPLPKLDNVAGPGQSQFFSAMENWGAIFTFERVLLNDPKITSARAKQRIFSVDAHEIAHQWFGNLVTMQWWDDLWLNEGFASWMESKTTVHFNPEWQAEIDRVYGRNGAMGQDAYVTTHPIIQPIQTVEQTSQAFDGITYSKGEAVITMLEGYAGENVWRDGIRAYIAKHAYGNTKTDDLWNAVEAAGAKGLTRIAHDFTKQPGVPLIRVEGVTCEAGNSVISLTQGEFSRDRKAETDTNPLRWNVPVIGQILGHAPASTIVENGKGQLTLPGCGTLLINAGQSGYYRTLYQPDQIAALKADFAKLDAIDQVGLVTDTRNLADGEYQELAPALDLLNAVPANASQRVLETAAGSFAGLYDLFRDDAAAQAKLASIADSRFAPALKKLGFVQQQGESTVDSNLRSALIGILGTMGNADVKAEAARLFAALDENPAALDGPLRTTWLSLIAYNADRATWDKIRRLGQESTNNVVRSTMYALLGSAKDKDLAAEALKLALTDEPGKTTSAAIIGRVSGEHPEMAVDFALANEEAVLNLVDVSSRSEYIAQLAFSSDQAETVKKLENYAQTRLTPESRKTADQAIAAINTRIASRPRIKNGVKNWLAAQ